jgi:hypothetical protein
LDDGVFRPIREWTYSSDKIDYVTYNGTTWAMEMSAAAGQKLPHSPVMAPVIVPIGPTWVIHWENPCDLGRVFALGPARAAQV